MRYVTQSIFSKLSDVVGAKSARVRGIEVIGGGGGGEDLGGLGLNSMPIITIDAKANKLPRARISTLRTQ